MNTKSPLSVSTQIRSITESIKELKEIVPELKRPSTQEGTTAQDLNRQEMVKSIIYCLRDTQYKLLHKPAAKRKYASGTEKLTLAQVLSLLNVYEQNKLNEPLLKETDQKEIKLTFERCFIRLSDVKKYIDFRNNLHTTLSNIRVPASQPAHNIETDELF